MPDYSGLNRGFGHEDVRMENYRHFLLNEHATDFKRRRNQRIIIGHYGLENQKQKLKEEMTELAYARDDENFIEEMADVLNVLEGIITHIDCWDKVRKIQLQKLERQIKRMEVENAR